MSIPCEVVKDLLPLCCDGFCSEESRRLVEEHLQTCPACREEQRLMTGELRAEQRRAGDEELAKAASAVWKKGKRGAFVRGALIVTALALAVLAAVGLSLWRVGWFYIADRVPSPDGSASATVYDRTLDGWDEGVGLIVRLADGGEYRSTYLNCGYNGLWWSPDGNQYVLALENFNGGDYIELARLDLSNSSNLTILLNTGVQASELQKYGFVEDEEGRTDIRYQFLQWGLDSASMLFYYSFEDGDGALHDGYFWFNSDTLEVTALLELELNNG